MQCIIDFIPCQVDQLIVSLVDKDLMRSKLAAIAQTLKGWLKSSLANRTATVFSIVQGIAQLSLKEEKVSQFQNNFT